ncbi:MAG: SurA N-terminal domain-containing protein [Candidatus Omnitrophica bacterium]|nr:SurA N-terminal domain-containing protein [Candidatus Omnitrophota bacterium]
MRKKNICAALCAVLLIMSAAGGALAQDKVVAVVNDEIITQKDLDSFIAFMRVQMARDYSGVKLEQKIDSMKQDLLERLIEDRLILQEAKKSNINADKNMIKAKIAELKRAHNSDREFQDYLIQQGMTEADLEQKMKNQMMTYQIVEEKIKNKIVIKPSDITEYYEKNVDQFMVPQEREFVSIVVDTQELADKVSADLSAGKTPDEVAGLYSITVNTFTAKKGGELKKEIEDVVFGMNLNDVSKAVKIDEAYYVFKLTKITAEFKQPLIDAQAGIKRMLFDKRLQEDMVDWLDQLKKKSFIKI